MPAIFWSSPAHFQTGIAFFYSVADSTSNSAQDVVWKMVGKADWRILCRQVGTKLMNCLSVLSLPIPSVYYFTAILSEKFILLGPDFWLRGNLLVAGSNPAEAIGFYG
jgi:hypothetical protein